MDFFGEWGLLYVGMVIKIRKCVVDFGSYVYGINVM